jgi:hypothetical protein
MIDAYVAEIGRPQSNTSESAPLASMSDEERRDLLSALKAKWDSVNKQYQKQAHIVKLDTVGMIKRHVSICTTCYFVYSFCQRHRKEHLEKELSQIEADIKKLASRGAVFVAE